MSEIQQNMVKQPDTARRGKKGDEVGEGDSPAAVSYTHLTLPTT